MKKLTLAISLILSVNAYADDNNVTNSNNTNYSTTTQSNAIDNTGQDHSNNAVDSSTHSSADDNSGNDRGNYSDSYNQANQSTTNQDINNSVTKNQTVGGNLQDGEGNVINHGTNAGGGDVKSSSYSEAGDSNAKAYGGDSSSISKVNYSGNSQQGQQQAQGQKVRTGAVTNKTTYAPSSVNNNNFRRIPVATAVSMGQVAHNTYSCDPINGAGVQTMQAGISLSISRKEGFCRGMVAADVMTHTYNMPQVGCEIVKMTAAEEADNVVARAMEMHHITCANINSTAIVAPVVVPLSPMARDTQARLDSLAPINPSVSAIHGAIMRK